MFLDSSGRKVVAMATDYNNNDDDDGIFINERAKVARPSTRTYAQISNKINLHEQR